MDIKDRIVALLNVSSGPLGIDAITGIVANGEGVEVRAAILDLLMDGMVRIDSDSVSLCSRQSTLGLEGDANEGGNPDRSSMQEEGLSAEQELALRAEVGQEAGRDSELRPESSTLFEPDLLQGQNKVLEPVQGTQPEVASDCRAPIDDRKIDEREEAEVGEACAPAVEVEDGELPPWPWPELADAPYEEELPPWPWPELADAPFDERELLPRGDVVRDDSDDASFDDLLGGVERLGSGSGSVADQFSVHVRERVYGRDSVDVLDLPKQSKKKLNALGINTIFDLVSRIDSLAKERISPHLLPKIRNGVRIASDSVSLELSDDQVQALRVFSGSGEFGFDMFGALVELPSSASEGDAGVALSGKCYLVEEDVELNDVLGSDVLVRNLRRGGIATLGELLLKTDEELLAIKGFGVTKLERLKEEIEKLSPTLSSVEFPEVADEAVSGNQAESERDARIEKLLESSFEALDPDGSIIWFDTYSVVMKPFAAEALNSGADEPVGAVVDAFWSLPSIEQRCQTSILDRLNRPNTNHGESPVAVQLSNDSRWRAVVQKLVDDRTCDCSDAGLVTTHVLSLEEWLPTLNQRDRRMLHLRFEGMTLEDIGDELDVTRERVRQIQKRALGGRPALKEDVFAHFVNTYSMGREDFCKLTECEGVAYGYLDTISTTKKVDRLPLAEASNDPEVPAEVRMKLATEKIENYVIVSGRQVPARKYDITLAILSEKGANCPVSLVYLIGAYKAVLQVNGEAENGALSTTSDRAYGAWLARQPGILYAPVPKSVDPEDRSIRIYDDASKDFSILVNYLQSGEFHDVECSSALVLNKESFAEVKDALDIRNEYELHVIIRRFCGSIEGLELGRCPIMRFGDGDRREQLKELIEKLGPISAADLALAYEQAYGVDAFSVQMNYLKDVSGYLVGDFYEIKQVVLDESQMSYLRFLLKGDVLSLANVRRQFSERFLNAEPQDVNSLTLKPLGYEIRRGLVMRRGFDMASYSAKLLDSVDRFKNDEEPFIAELFADDDFKAVLDMRLRSFALVEVAQNSYESMESLKRDFPEMSANLLTDYVNSLVEFLGQGDVETISSVRRKGFVHPLQDMIDGSRFGTAFLEGVASMGYVGGKLKRTRINSTFVFSRRIGALTVDDVVSSAAKRCGSADPRAVHSTLLETYGIRMSGAHVRAVLDRIDKDSQLVAKGAAASLQFERNESNAYEGVGGVVGEADADSNDDLVGCITEIVEKRGRMPIARLMGQLQSQYGVSTSSVQLRAAVKKASVDFDEKRDFVSRRGV